MLNSILNKNFKTSFGPWSALDGIEPNDDLCKFDFVCGLFLFGMVVFVWIGVMRILSECQASLKHAEACFETSYRMRTKSVEKKLLYSTQNEVLLYYVFFTHLWKYYLLFLNSQTIIGWICLQNQAISCFHVKHNCRKNIFLNVLIVNAFGLLKRYNIKSM